MKNALAMIGLLLAFTHAAFGNVAIDTTTGGKCVGATSFTVTLTTNGTNRVAVLAVECSTGHVSSISGGGSWTNIVASHAVASSGNGEMWYALFATTQTSVTLTVNLSTSMNASGVLDTYSGAATSSPIENTNWTDTTTAQTSAPGSVTTLSSNAFVASYIFYANPSALIGSATAGTGYTTTTAEVNTPAGSSEWLAQGERANSVTASPTNNVSAPFSWGSNQKSSVLAISIRPPSTRPNYIIVF